MHRMFVLSIALGGVLAVAACSPSTGTPPPTGPIATSAPTTSPATPSSTGTTIRVRDFTLDPGTVAVTGTTVTLAVTNEGPTVHNVRIRDESGTDLFGTRDLREGESETISQELTAGEYVLFCSLAGHESLGIKGTLTVATP